MKANLEQTFYKVCRKVQDQSTSPRFSTAKLQQNNYCQTLATEFFPQNFLLFLPT